MLTARYNGQWFRWHDEPGGLTLAGSGTQYKNDVHTLLVSDTALISNRMLNQVRFQFARYTDLRRDLNPSLYVARSGYSIEGGRSARTASARRRKIRGKPPTRCRTSPARTRSSSAAA